MKKYFITLYCLTLFGNVFATDNPVNLQEISSTNKKDEQALEEIIDNSIIQSKLSNLKDKVSDAISVKNLIYISIIGAIAYNYNFIIKHSKQFLKKKYNKKRDSVPYTIPLDTPLIHTFENYPELYEAMKKAYENLTTTRRRCLESLKKKLEDTNTEDIRNGKKPSKKDAYKCLIEQIKIFEEDYGKAEEL